MVIVLIRDPSERESDCYQDCYQGERLRGLDGEVGDMRGGGVW